MATQEWVSSDNEIWQWDGVDDFIWLPGDILGGLGVFVAVGQLFQYSSDIGPAQFVADKQQFQYIADKE